MVVSLNGRSNSLMSLLRTRPRRMSICPFVGFSVDLGKYRNKEKGKSAYLKSKQRSRPLFWNERKEIDKGRPSWSQSSC